MVVAWGGAVAMLSGVCLILPWALGSNATRPWRAAGWGMILFAVGLVALVVAGIAS